MVSPGGKRPGSGHSYASLKLAYLLEEGRQEPQGRERGLSSVKVMTTVTSWPRVPKVLNREPLGSKPSCRNASARPHQGLQDLSVREDGKRQKVAERER
jgi:hypothetical protein